MDEGAIVTNIATILAKDLLLDKNLKFRPIPYPIKQAHEFLQDDDDGLDIFVYNMLHKKKLKSFEKDKNKKRSDRESQYTEDSSSISDTVITPVGSASQLVQNMEINLHILQFMPPRDFEINFHMRRDTFNALHELMGPLMKESIRKFKGSLLSTDTFLSLAVWKLATSQHYEEISRRFKIPVNICHQSTINFCDLISDYIGIFTAWPTPNQFLSLNKRSQILGILGTLRLDVFLESEDAEVEVVLQLVCSIDFNVIDCYVDLASSYSFQDTPVWRRLCSSFPNFPPGCFLLGDSSFPLKSFLITPFSEVGDDRKKAHFNHFVSGQLKTFQSTVKQMMDRFQCLYSLEAKDLKEMEQIVKTICGLHNFCIRFRDTSIPTMPELKLHERSNRSQGDESDPDGIRRRNEIYL